MPKGPSPFCSGVQQIDLQKLYSPSFWPFLTPFPPGPSTSVPQLPISKGVGSKNGLKQPPLSAPRHWETGLASVIAPAAIVFLLFLSGWA